jgi:hypothetical protein
MTLVPRSNPKVSLPITTSIGTARASASYLRFLKTVCVCVVIRDSNPWFMLVLGIGDVEASALVVSGGAQDNDMTLVSCLERVSYVKVFFYLSDSLIF